MEKEWEQRQSSRQGCAAGKGKGGKGSVSCCACARLLLPTLQLCAPARQCVVPTSRAGRVLARRAGAQAHTAPQSDECVATPPKTRAGRSAAPDRGARAPMGACESGVARVAGGRGAEGAVQHTCVQNDRECFSLPLFHNTSRSARFMAPPPDFASLAALAGLPLTPDVVAALRSLLELGAPPTSVGAVLGALTR